MSHLIYITLLKHTGLHRGDRKRRSEDSARGRSSCLQWYSSPHPLGFFQALGYARFGQRDLVVSRSVCWGGQAEVCGGQSETSTMMRRYHSPQCRPISFPPSHWPSLDNGSCWLKASSVLCAVMMDASPVLCRAAVRTDSLFHVETRAITEKGVRPATAFPSFSGNWLRALQLLTVVNNVVICAYHDPWSLSGVE